MIAEDEPPRVAHHLLSVAGEQAIVFGELPNVIEEQVFLIEEPMKLIDEPVNVIEEPMNGLEEQVNVVDQLLFADVRRPNASVGSVCFEVRKGAARLYPMTRVALAYLAKDALVEAVIVFTDGYLVLPEREPGYAILRVLAASRVVFWDITLAPQPSDHVARAVVLVLRRLCAFETNMRRVAPVGPATAPRTNWRARCRPTRSGGSHVWRTEDRAGREEGGA